MKRTEGIKSLHNAKKDKKNEFYTQLEDIEKELKHYKHYFKNKIVYCNCDDPKISNFFHYFSYNFENSIGALNKHKLSLVKLSPSAKTIRENSSNDIVNQIKKRK